MALPIEFHSGALEDFKEARDWYTVRSDRAAFNFVLAVDEAIERVAADPERFLQAPANCRYCMLKRYPFRIVFSADDARLLIVAIAHAKRRPEYWKNRIS